MSGLYSTRREFLAAVGSVGAVTIAGCSGDGDGGGDTPTETPTPSPTPTPTTPNEDAVEHYDAAIDLLSQNKETLDEWAASSFEPDEVGTLQNRVSTAREDLDAAEAAADSSGDLVVQIDQARVVANFQGLILAYYEAVNVFFQGLSEASNFGDNELHQRAADTYAEAQTVLEDARTVIDDMGTMLEEIDNETLNEPGLAYTGEPLDHIDLADRRAIDGAESYAKAYENIHLAFVQLETGQEHYENEEFTEAREAWETGHERARDSKTAFEAVIDNDFSPPNLRQDSINRIADTEIIIEAFGKFVEGAEEAEAGNFEEANNLVGEGFDILGQL